MAHATLIHPPTVLYMSSLSYTNSIPPLGLAYVSAAAKAAGHGVHVVDACGTSIFSMQHECGGKEASPLSQIFGCINFLPPPAPIGT